jgi:hypothetical protein
MPTVESPSVTGDLSEAVLAKLQDAPGPLKLADVSKGLPKPKKVKVAEFQQEEILPILEEQVRRGLAFRNPSGKDGAERFWNKDEKHLLREKAVELASNPQTLAGMSKSLGQEVKGVDKTFVETVVRELIGDDILFEYPPVSKKAGPRFCSVPLPLPVPVLEQPKHKKSLNSLVTATQKLLAAAQIPVEELLRVLRERLDSSGSEIIPKPAGSAQDSTPKIEEKPAVNSRSASIAELENLILKEVANAPVVSLLDLRGTLPTEFQGSLFDETVLRLANDQRILVHQDINPTSLSDAERAGYVQDGHHVYTTISNRD